jgi:hypothetical protein
MIVLFQTDKNINGSEEYNSPFILQITEELKSFSGEITKIIAHVSDENAAKTGVNDKKCVLEVRVEGKQPIAVSFHANSVQAAVTGAIEKIKINFEKLNFTPIK